MTDQTENQLIGVWLGALASGEPTPGGGAVAAMLAAQGAALVSMVAELTIGKPAYAEHEQTMLRALAASRKLRQEALQAADADATAFDAVMATYKLPKGTDEETADRSKAIQEATFQAAQAPLSVAAIAAGVIEQAHRIEAGANVNVISDVAVAAQCAHAALDAAAINVEINLAALKDPARKAELRQALDGHLASIATADLIISEVRERIAK